jgi:ubiquitin C-terminal hydrolase
MDMIINVPDQRWYQLRVAVIHQGRMDSGHYTSLVRVGTQWYCADDSKVYPVSSEAAQTTIDQDAYLMLYEKQEFTRASDVEK